MVCLCVLVYSYFDMILVNNSLFYDGGVTPGSMKGWRKKWFYLKNDDSTPLPVFTSGCHVPLTSWGEGAAGKDLSKIQPLREHLQQVRWEGLTGIHLLRTFFSRQI
jgi:hypothetical protein